MFVGAVIVHDQMQVQPSGRLAIYLFEETDKLLMSMAWHAVTDNLAVEHTEGGEQGGRAIALVIVGHGAATTFLHWQARLGSVERLDLTLLVHTQAPAICPEDSDTGPRHRGASRQSACRD